MQQMRRRLPVTAINSVGFTADKDPCIACIRCINVRPQDAHSISKTMAKIAIREATSIRKECELYA